MNFDRKGLQIASELGIDQVLLNIREKFGTDSLGPKVSVANDITSFELKEEDRKGDVLLPPIEGGHVGNIQRAGILAHAFRSRGYRPIMYLCNNDLNLCHPRGKNRDDRSQCALCHFKGNKHLQAFGIDHISFEEVLPKNYQPPEVSEYDDLRAVEYKNVPVADFVTGSARRLLKQYRLDLEDPSVRSLYERLLESSMKLVDLTLETMSQFEVECVLSNHHAYVYGGTILSTADQNDIPSYCYGGTSRDNTVCFGQTSTRTSSMYDTDEEFVRSRLDEPLSNEEGDTADSLMRARRTGEDRFEKFPKESDSSFSTADSTLNVGIFTNLVWDASIVGAQPLFEDYFRWISETIETLKDVDGVEVILKTHPAEALRGTNESVYDWIHEEYQPLPSNLSVVEPNTDFDPYDMMEALDAGIVYNSTVGMEMAYYGKPVIVAGATHYRGYGFTYDSESIEQYRSLLESIDDLECTDEMEELARRYVYFYLYEKHIPVPGASKIPGKDEYPHVQHSDIGPGAEQFDNLVRSVIEGRPVVRPE
ncbi:hypothetical protein ACOZ4N_17685 [Halorientalis pallida]|uniref:capsular polysaccharide export protein, LipB/KpsS family n=1 Tax=Halorientalis pallida TaxID=2479928 RepID=UPI003C70482B